MFPPLPVVLTITTKSAIFIRRSAKRVEFTFAAPPDLADLAVDKKVYAKLLDVSAPTPLPVCLVRASFLHPAPMDTSDGDLPVLGLSGNSNAGMPVKGGGRAFPRLNKVLVESVWGDDLHIPSQIMIRIAIASDDTLPALPV